MVLNYEEGGEMSVLHGDPSSENALTDMDRPAALVGERNANVEQIFEYGARVGVWEVMRLLKSRGVEATVYAVGMALERNPEVAARAQGLGRRGRVPRATLDRLPIRPGSRGAGRHATLHRDRHASDRPASGRLV